MEPRFDIIVTIWNRLAYTKRTLASLIDSGAVQDCERLIIVDNRSTEEGMDAFLRDMYENMPAVSGKVWLLRRGKNDGWATAVNDALGLSRAPFLFLINNDVEFTPNFHKKMLETMSSSPLGLLGAWRHNAHSVTEARESYDCMTDVPAVCWLLSKRAMIDVGMLEMRGPCLTKGGNGEDSEYVQRIKAAGYEVGAMKQDVATHIDGY